jgi:membrane protein required for beta-lactamase induction
MTIIAILLAFTLCHFIRELGRVRKNRWLTRWVGFANEAFGGLPGWADMLGFLVILAVPLVVLLLVNQVLYSALGTTGAFLLALAVLICVPTDSIPTWRNPVRKTRKTRAGFALPTRPCP